MKKYVVSKDALLHNINVVKKAAQGRYIYAVLKGGGYGMGVAQAASVLREAGISRFAVCEVKEAEEIRGAGFEDDEILMLTPVSDTDEMKRLTACRATVTVSGLNGARLAAAAARELETVVRAHIKIDTGMGRFGFLPEENDKILSIYNDFPEIKIEGMYTHFYKAWNDEKATRRQLSAFLSVADKIKEAGFDTGIRHAANTPALFKYPFALLDAVRPGSAFAGAGDPGLKAVGKIEAGIIEIKTLQRGWNVGYGGGTRLKRETRTAVLPVGYADGLSLSREGAPASVVELLVAIRDRVLGYLGKRKVFAEVNGKRAPIIGKVSMTNCVLDITGVDASVGDIAKIKISPVFAGARLDREYLED